MRFLLLATAMSAQELRRVDDAADGGAVIALNSTADDRPIWADGRLAVAVAATDGSLIELALCLCLPPQPAGWCRAGGGLPCMPAAAVASRGPIGSRVAALFCKSSQSKITLEEQPGPRCPYEW